jgi:alkylation response protein AidB-like acyl-CoA dehydrogenase
VNFDFDETQYALRDLARDLFSRESPPSRLRGLWDGKPWDRGVWRTMAEAGLCGITVPEAYGGTGGSEIDLALVAEEAGRAALPEPLVETVAIAAPAIRELGSEDVRERWLPAIASGEAIVAVEGPSDGYAAWAGEADLVICVRDGTAHALPRERYQAAPLPAIDPARPLYRVEAETGPDTALAGPLDWSRALCGTAGVLNGIAMRLLEMTLEHVKAREQFGRPVGSFQAVKHKLADMHAAIASARPAAWYAAYAITTGAGDAGDAAAVARVAAGNAEALCNRESLQCHGGMGFTWEHDLHLWLKRGIVLRSAFGDPAVHRRTIAHRLIAP